MENIYLDLGSAYETCREAWREAMTKGDDFSIADALGPEVTASILNSPLAGHLPIQGAIAGIIDALASKSPQVQKLALEQAVPFETAAGLSVRTRDIAASSRWISAALKAKLNGAKDPISVIDSDIVGELTSTGALGDALGMSKYLAAVTLVGAKANFPDKTPISLKAAAEMTAIADAAEEQGEVTPGMINIVLEKGATLNIGGVHGKGNIVAAGNHSQIAVHDNLRTQKVKPPRVKKSSFWKNPKFYGWLVMALLAALTLYATMNPSS